MSTPVEFLAARNPACNETIRELSRKWAERTKKWATNGAFPLHGTVRLSSGRFAFPPQFSTAIEWAGLFTRRYNCAASTAVTSS